MVSKMAAIKELELIEGPNLTLRLIQPKDAAFVYGLRTNSLYNKHLSAVRGTVEDQRRWIDAYKDREAERNEFYYLIERKDGVPCGVVRLYDMDADSFTWGSWILDENKPPKAALESAVLSFGIGFNALDRKMARVDVRTENDRAQAFYQRFGMIETHRTKSDIFFTYPRSQYQADRESYMMVLRGEVGV
ncbi:GNAT family N-acetyltransferase [Pseudophaeobacter sp. EL27]|uniref:GNAT family N-acetyltransferase n=1 Tax=Pseudophaeobacter sp. EL27 TaxID=2107580 RepID=UPI0020B1474F|nr:GNAT family N-acetyltransferase [Pseudophaeobacter sp. EL27]